MFIQRIRETRRQLTMDCITRPSSHQDDVHIIAVNLQAHTSAQSEGTIRVVDLLIYWHTHNCPGQPR